MAYLTSEKIRRGIWAQHIRAVSEVSQSEAYQHESAKKKLLKELEKKEAPTGEIIDNLVQITDFFVEKPSIQPSWKKTQRNPSGTIEVSEMPLFFDQIGDSQQISPSVFLIMREADTQESLESKRYNTELTVFANGYLWVSHPADLPKIESFGEPDQKDSQYTFDESARGNVVFKGKIFDFTREHLQYLAEWTEHVSEQIQLPSETSGE